MNRNAWEAAITTASNQGQPLYIPAGTYVLELSGAQSKGVVLA
jgi:polygalacturonase